MLRVKYFIIIVLLIFLMVAIIISCPTPEEIRYAREDREKWEYMREQSRQEQEYFEELTEYCKEHEDVYMNISEEIFAYLDEGLSKDEARTSVEKNASLEQKEILEKHSLCFPRDTNDTINYYVGLRDNALYYGGGDTKIVYIHEFSEEIEENIMSVEYTTTVKINDHLYVCYTKFPYD